MFEISQEFFSYKFFITLKILFFDNLLLYVQTLIFQKKNNKVFILYSSYLNLFIINLFAEEELESNSNNIVRIK